MRKYFDYARQKTKEKFQHYWRRLFNRSNEHKMSEGAQQVDKVITSAHKDQWRRDNKHSK